MVSSDHSHGELLLKRRRSGLQMVFLDRPAPVPEIDSVTTDNRVGACAAVTHLAASGHRRIAFLGDLHSIWTAAERERGYLEGLAAARIPVDRGLHGGISGVATRRCRPRSSCSPWPTRRPRCSPPTT